MALPFGTKPSLLDRLLGHVEVHMQGRIAEVWHRSTLELLVVSTGGIDHSAWFSVTVSPEHSV